MPRGEMRAICANIGWRLGRGDPGSTGWFFLFSAMDACLRQQYALAAAVLALVLYVVYLATMG